jgi:hypothetical protein
MLTQEERMHRYEARYQATLAVRSGLVPKGDECAECGVEAKLVGHHDDYDDPLSLRWLCYPCHAVCHSRQREVAAGVPQVPRGA